MDQATSKAYGQAVGEAFEHQQVLLVSYMNKAGEISTRKLVPCSPFALNTDGTVNFNAYSEIVKTTGQDRGPGVFTFRLDRLLSVELDDFEIEDVQGFWRDILGATNGGTVVFPGPKTPLWRGKFPNPTLANGALDGYLAKDWSSKPKKGFVQKTTRANSPQSRLRLQ